MGLSPMMQEYVNTKEEYSDCILFYRLGDFYEMFFEDAILVSKELELTLTKKACGLEEKAPMCGVPHHSVNTYLQKLVQKGYKVAICEQLEDAKEAKGLVKRGVIQIVTPGTIIDQDILNEKENNYIMAIYAKDSNISISACDLTTGDFFATTFNSNIENKKLLTLILNEVARFSPKEIIIPKSLEQNEEFVSTLKNVFEIYVTVKEDEYFETDQSTKQYIQDKYNIVVSDIDQDILNKKLGDISTKIEEKKEEELEENENQDSQDEFENLNLFSLDENEEDDNETKTEIDSVKSEENSNEGKNKRKISSASLDNFDPNILRVISAIDKYILDTQKQDILHIDTIKIFSFMQYMSCDVIARKNLELTSRMKDGSKKGTLLWVLDKTKTSMGARLLNRWVNDPLVNLSLIKSRQDAIETFFNDIILLGSVQSILATIYDIERISSKISFRSINAKDMISLKTSIQALPELKKQLALCKDESLSNAYASLDTLDDIYAIIDQMIVDDPPITIQEGGIIKEGFSKELDDLKNIDQTAKNWIVTCLEREKEATGIKNLKIGYNKVFGYYLEVTNSFLNMVPETYIRKQTLTGAERYVTPELKQIEEEILNAQDKIAKIEYDLFNSLKDYVKNNLERIKTTSNIIAYVDCIASLAKVAKDGNYCKPVVSNNGIIDISDGRHPVIEKTIKENFVENDCYLDLDKETVHIITGPNMAGKSTYMRQVALIVLLAQIGSYVPAKYAQIGIVDQIFTRIGASDDLFLGQSTFMTEMLELSNILVNSTKNSLVILDEIGRGTSTYDGLSIATSTVKYIADVNKIGCKTLFATHYHELTNLEAILDNVKNYHVKAKEIGNDIIFLRKVVRGGSDQSYGIHVARLAKIPEQVLKDSQKILDQLTKHGQDNLDFAHILSNGTISKEDIKSVKKDNVGNVVDGNSDSNVVLDPNISAAIQILKDLDINSLSPIDALNKIYEIKKMIDEK